MPNGLSVILHVVNSRLLLLLPHQQELIDELKKAEKALFDLRFKKATRQPFKSHEIKATKKEVARIKTLLREKV